MTKSQKGIAIGAGVLLAAYFLTRKKDPTVDIVEEALTPVKKGVIRPGIAITRQDLPRVPEIVTRPGTIPAGSTIFPTGRPPVATTGPSMFQPYIPPNPFTSTRTGLSVQMMNEGYHGC